MAEKRYYWLKLSEDFFRDKPIKRLRRLAGGDTYTIIYLKMLLRSLINNGVLYYEGIEDNFIEELSLDLDEDVDNVTVTVQYLEKKGLLQVCEKDEFLLTQCGSMTGSETSSAARVRRHRESTKTLQCNTDVTFCNTEIELEKELDKEIEIDKPIKKRTVFKPPTVEQVKEYCLERNNNIDAEYFIDFYASKGWMVGKNKMKDWKASLRTWERKDKKSANTDKIANRVSEVDKWV